MAGDAHRVRRAVTRRDEPGAHAHQLDSVSRRDGVAPRPDRVQRLARLRARSGRDAVFHVLDKTRYRLHSLLGRRSSLLEHRGRDAFDSRHRGLLSG
jgi:hypothetical protein